MKLLFSKIDHFIGHKASINKCKKTEIASCILSDHNTIKLGSQQQKKYQNIVKWSVGHTDIREEMKKFLEFNENETQRR
jgi:hypothetical protein